MDAVTRESPRNFTEDAIGVLSTLPAVIDPSAQPGDFGVVADGIWEFATLVERIAARQQADCERLREFGERGPVTLRDRREAEACVGRMLDGEQARDLMRDWWDVNQEPLRSLAARIGSDEIVRAADAWSTPMAAEGCELRAWLRTAQETLRGTRTQRMKRYVRSRYAAALRRLAAVLERHAGSA